ncbi:MAG: YbaB/EbfC family nucleoid-associated protein [Proteobacteria bacterium]|nr:YbaB/EbfC family nucleoid-associated protein [Pseudomonadota bacterium]
MGGQRRQIGAQLGGAKRLGAVSGAFSLLASAFGQERKFAGLNITGSGGLKVQSLKIAPEVVDPDDIEMLEDLVTAAVNEALQGVQALQMQQLGGLAGQLGISLPG